MSTTTLLMIAGIIVLFIIPSFKDRVIPIKKMIIMPALFMYLLSQTISESFSLGFANIISIMVGIVVGSAIGIFIRINTTIKADKTQDLIWLPGSYLSLIIFPSIFLVHYLVGYIHAVSPSYLMQASIAACVLLFLLTATSSITVGTNLCFAMKYYFASTEELELPAKK